MTEALRHEIIRRHQAGLSMRHIARELGLSRNTVRRALTRVAAARAGVTDPPAPRRPSQLDPFEPVMRELLTRYPNLTAVRLWQELRQRGFTRSYSSVRQLRPRPAPPPVRRFETGPGLHYVKQSAMCSEAG